VLPDAGTNVNDRSPATPLIRDDVPAKAAMIAILILARPVPFTYSSDRLTPPAVPYS